MIRSLIRRHSRKGSQGLAAASRYCSHEPLQRTDGNYAKSFPTLFHPLPQLRPPPFLPDCPKPYPTKVTTLPNGLRIASEDALVPAACIGIFVDSGSIYETEESAGVTHLLEKMAFKSTTNRSHLRIVREVETTGGNVGASASREQMVYSYDTLKTHVPEAVEILIDCVRNPAFDDCEVKDQVAKVAADTEEFIKDPQQFLQESVNLVGYSGALAKPLIVTDGRVKRIDGSVIEKFYRENYTPNRMVLAAYGVDHDQLLALAEPLLHDLPRGPSVEVPKSSYCGGELRRRADSERTHVALSFEVPGGWLQEKDATAVTVLQTLMGGGGSFSAGGPGKGMHSRLYLNVLNKFQQMHSISAFTSIYNETGLFGVLLATGPDFVAKGVHAAINELLAIATPGKVTQLELQRAKNSTRSAILMNLECRAVVTEDIGRQLLTYGCRKTVDHFLQCLDELTLDDITALAQKMFSTPLTMACYGDVDRVPSYEFVSQHFRAKELMR